MERGFSLAEVLVSLLLIVSISLALLKQQWQMSRVSLEIQRQARVWRQASNDTESGIPHHRSKQQGLGLIELMIGLILSMAIMSLLMQQYQHIRLQTQQIERTVHEASRLQIALDFIRSVGHKAGFTPCLPLNYLRTLDRDTGQTLRAIALPSAALPSLRLQRMNDHFTLVSRIESHQLYLASSLLLAPKHPLMIADCQHAEVHSAFQQFATPHGAVIALERGLHFDYQPPIYIGEWVEESFLLQSNRQAVQGLFYRRHHHRDELLPGISVLTGTLDHGVLHLEMRMHQGPTIPLAIRVYNS